MKQPLSTKGQRQSRPIGYASSSALSGVIAEADQALRVVFNNTYDAILLHTPHGRVFDANDTFLRLYGADRAELPNVTIQRISSDSMSMEVARQIWGRVLNGEPQFFEWKARRFDNGVEFDVEVFLRPISIGGEEVILANVRDITQRKAAELRAGEAKQLARLRLDGLQVLQKPAEWRQLLQSFCELLVEGFDAAFVRVWTLREETELVLQASAGCYTHLNGPHSRIPLGKLKIGRIAQERRLLLSNQVVGDPEISDQAWAQQEKMIAFAGTALVSEGRLLGVIALFARHALSPAASETFEAIAGTLAQALARKQAETAVREAKEEWERTFNSMPDLIALIDREQRVVRVNQAMARKLGCTPNECIGRSCFECLHGPTCRPTNCPHKRTQTDGQTHSSEVHEEETGEFFIVTTTPLLNDQNQIIGSIHVSRNITARKRAEMELKQAQAALALANVDLERKVLERTAQLEETIAELEHFSYTLTHDMRAPLRAMQGLGGILLDKPGDPIAAPREYLGRIAEAAARMDKLITDALQYSSTLRHEFALQPVDTERLLRGILDSYPQFEKTRSSIRIEGPLPVVLGNEAALTQCFSNLLANAVKFTKPDQAPEILIRSETRGAYVRLWFHDKGIGIPGRYHEKIWVMFQKLDKNTEGTGIGLALVRKVVEQMGGRAGLESIAGEGSSFWIELQAVAAPSVRSTHKP